MMSSSSSSETTAPANIRVLVRVRPINDREARFNSSSVLEIDDGGDGGSTSAIDFGMNGQRDGESSSTGGCGGGGGGGGGTISIVDPSVGASAGGGYGSGYDSGAATAAATSATTAQRSFTYDAVFGPRSRQDQVYESVRGIVDAVCAGYNGTIVAYGQTGSGKTHTIFGEDGLQDNNNAGLVQRSVKSIFHKIEEQSIMSPTSSAAAASDGASIRTTTNASFFEIYNERVYDLLSPNLNIAEDDKGLPVREDAARGVYVEGLIQRDVCNNAEAMDVLRRGMDNRSVAATNMNRVSSRSHAMFVLTVKSESISEGGIGKTRVSKFTLVDLAGSERQRATATDGDRLKEASMINNSLLCLGQVINSLVDREKGKLGGNHVPFRDSKLTFLLRDSWGGNSKTCLVATVTPSLASLSETMSTLKFAQRAKLIKNTAVLNENTSGSVASLQAEIVRLRAELELKNDSTSRACDGDRPETDAGMPSLDSKPSADEKGPATVATVSALRNQNSKMSKKVKVLKDASSHRELQVNTLKRKLQQEMMIRKCKERRINYLAGKGNATGMEVADEVSALSEEVAILREQLEARPSESIEWMIKYNEEKSRVEEMEANATNSFETDEKNELEASLVALLDERDSLQKKLETMSHEHNTEIDSILMDVTKFEDANIMLQSQLEKKEVVLKENAEKIQSNDAHIGELEKEMEAAIDCLESTQNDLAAEKKKAMELQESIDSVKIELSEANTAVADYQGKMAIAEEELRKLTDWHNESNTKITDLTTNLSVVMGDNDSLIKKLEKTSDELDSKKTELEGLGHDKSEALKQLEIFQEKSTSDLEAFELKEETLMAEILELEGVSGSLLVEKAQAAANLVNVAAHNGLLSDEVEALKLERGRLQKRVESLENLRDVVASLEDELAIMTIEKEQAEVQLQFTQADLERAIELQDHLSDAQTAAHDHDLALSDEIIGNMTREKSDMQKELTIVTQKLVENRSDLSKLQDHANCLEAEVRKAEEDAKAFLSEKAQHAEQLEQITAQKEKLSDKVEALRADRDELQFKMTAETTELQMNLAMAVNSKESLAERLKDAVKDLEVKNTQLEFLEYDKSEALKQLELSQEKYAADLGLFKLQEETLMAKIMKSEEAIESLRSEKDGAIASFENATAQNGDLQDRINTLEGDIKKGEETAETLRKLNTVTVDRLEEVTSQGDALTEEIKELRTERDTMQITLSTKLSEVQTNLDAAIQDKEALAEKLKGASEDLLAKKAQVESLENDKSNALEQLELGQEKNAADLRSFKLQEETLRAEIKEAEGAIESLRSEKVEAIADLDNATAQNGDLLDRVNTLEDDIKKAEETVETLRKQNIETVDRLEEVTSQGIILSEENGAIKAERDTLERTLNTKLSEIQTDLDATDKDKESLAERLKDASDDLMAKKAQIEGLESDKSNALEQLKLNQETNTAELDSFKLQEETLRAEIKKAESALESLHSEKNEVVSRLRDITKQNHELHEVVEALKSERDELQQHVKPLEKLRGEVEHITMKNVQLEERLKNLDQTVMLQKEADAIHTASHENELAQRDNMIVALTEEKSNLQTKLGKVTQQSNEEIELLQNKVVNMNDNLSVMDRKEKSLRFEFDAAIMNATEREAYFNTKILEVEVAKEVVMKELGSTKALLAESEGMKEEIKSKRARVSELEELVERTRTQNESLAVLAEDGEIAKAEIGMMKKDKLSFECNEEALKAKIAALEQENAALRRQSLRGSPSSPSHSVPSPKSSPIKPLDEELDKNSLCDETFDEDMFLPNVDENGKVNTALDVNGGEDHTPQTDENKSPSETPFKAKRAIFSPLSTQPSSKKPRIKDTPPRRVTRRMTRSMARTPLGKSALQNTPLSSCRKVRTNWNGGSIF